MFKLYLITFFTALVGAFVFTPLVRWLAIKFNAMDKPEERKVHREPVPRWGGLAIFLGFALSILVLLLLSRRFPMLLAYQHKIFWGKEFVGILNLGKQLSGILVASTVIVILGMIDDKKGVPPVPKLLTQIIAAYIAMDYGVRISGLVLPWGGSFLHLPILGSQIITVLWLVGFMNTVNLIDGLDGLAAGIVAIAAFTFCVVSVLQGDTNFILFAKQLKLSAILSAGLCGACLGFLYHNFNPAKIFMGDTGSMLLGFLLGTISVIGTLKTTAMIALFIPIIVIAVPIVDVVFAIVRRFRAGRPIMEADRGHFHHRLLDSGWTQKEVVLLMYVITILLSQGTVLLTLFKGMIPK